MENYFYTVGYALIDSEGNTITNWASKNVIATNALHAIKKARLSKKHIPEYVTQGGKVDVL